MHFTNMYLQLTTIKSHTKSFLISANLGSNLFLSFLISFSLKLLCICQHNGHWIWFFWCRRSLWFYKGTFELMHNLSDDEWTLKQWFSKWGSGTCSIRVICAHMKMWIILPTKDILIGNSLGGNSDLYFHDPSRWFCCTVKFGSQEFV